MKIIKIIDEILSVSFANQANEVDINVKVTGNQTRINFKGNCKSVTKEKLTEIEEMLNLEKQPELEQYYWELIGQNDYADELSIVGLMIDEAQVSYDPEEGIELTLYRTDKQEL